MKLKFGEIRESPYYGDVRPFRQFTFAGGINYSMLPTGIDFEKEMVDCSNMFVGLDNVLRVRYGTTEWYDSEVDSSVHGMGSYRGKLVYAVSNKVFMENTEIGTCASTGTVTFINAKGNLYILDGGVLKRFDGITYETVPNAPQCRYGIYHHNRLWVVGDVSYPSRVWISGPNDDEDWGMTGYQLGSYIDIDPFDNATITGMGLFFNSIIIFKNGEMPRIYRIDGLPAVVDSEMYQASNPLTVSVMVDIGNSCINPDSVVMTSVGILFMAKDGIYILEGKENIVTLISHNINRDLMFGDFSEENSVATFFPTLGLYVIASGSIVFVYNVYSKGWFKWDFAEYDVSCVNVIDGYLAFGTDDGRVFYMDTTHAKDDGEDITATLTTGYYTFGSIAIAKYVSEVYCMIDLPSVGEVTMVARPNYAPIYGVAMQNLYDENQLGIEYAGTGAGGQSLGEKKFDLLSEPLSAGFDTSGFGFDASETLGFDGRVLRPYLHKFELGFRCVNLGFYFEVKGVLATIQELEVVFYPITKTP